MDDGTGRRIVLLRPRSDVLWSLNRQSIHFKVIAIRKLLKQMYNHWQCEKMIDQLARF